MLIILVVAKDATPLSEFSTELSTREDVQLNHVCSAEDAWIFLENFKVDVVVADSRLADKPSLDFIKEVTRERPMVNCAMVSNLPPEEFHEATEGLGIFMQLPESPCKADAVKMIELLDSIGALMTT